MNIGSTIKKYRQQKDLTQEQLAEYLNVSVSAVSQWESAKTVPDISTILSLANFFDITLDELFDRTAKEKEKAIETFKKELASLPGIQQVYALKIIDDIKNGVLVEVDGDNGKIAIL